MRFWPFAKAEDRAAGGFTEYATGHHENGRCRDVCARRFIAG